MATITKRKRKDGSNSWRAQIRKKQGGHVVYQETRTFHLKLHAERWARARESALDEPGAAKLAKNKRKTLKMLIDDYMVSSRRMGRSKLGALKQMRGSALAKLDLMAIDQKRIIEHVKWRRQSTGPATVNNDLIWLKVMAKWAAPYEDEYPINAREIMKAQQYCKEQDLISRPKSRTRRPTDDELKLLTAYFIDRDSLATIPMHDIMWFAIHSARRQAEITRLLWSDNDKAGKTGMVRDLKHPRKKAGNDVRFKYTEKAWEILDRQPRAADQIFPYHPKSVGTAFRNACRMLEIEDLRFHDLRHEATSRLFEAGYSIPEVQLITLHRDWNALRRYTQLKPEDVPDR